MREFYGNPEWPVRFKNTSGESVPGFGLLSGGSASRTNTKISIHAATPTADAGESYFVNSPTASPTSGDKQYGRCKSVFDGAFWVLAGDASSLSAGDLVGPRDGSWKVWGDSGDPQMFVVHFVDTANELVLCSTPTPGKGIEYALLRICSDDLAEGGDAVDALKIQDIDDFSFPLGDSDSLCSLTCGAAEDFPPVKCQDANQSIKTTVCPAPSFRGVAFGYKKTDGTSLLGAGEYYGDYVVAVKVCDNWQALYGGRTSATFVLSSSLTRCGSASADLAIEGVRITDDAPYVIYPLDGFNGKLWGGGDFSGTDCEGHAVVAHYTKMTSAGAVDATRAENRWHVGGSGFTMFSGEYNGGSVKLTIGGCEVEEAISTGGLCTPAPEDGDTINVVFNSQTCAWIQMCDSPGIGCGLEYDDDGNIQVDNDTLAGTNLEPEGECALKVSDELVGRIEDLEACCIANAACCDTLTEIVTDLIECCEDSRECCYESMLCCYENKEDIDYIGDYCCSGIPSDGDCDSTCLWQWPAGGATADDWQLIVPCAGTDCDCPRPATIGTEAGDLEWSDCVDAGGGGACCDGNVPNTVTLTLDDLATPGQTCPCADGDTVTLTWNAGNERWENTSHSLGSCGSTLDIYVQCSEAGVWGLWQDCGTFGSPQYQGAADSTDCATPEIIWNDVLFYNACVGGGGCHMKVTLSWT